MKEIALTQCRVAIVDDEDYETLAAVKWYAMRDRRTFYAIRNIPSIDGRRTHELMHRLALARKLGRAIIDGMECDHINGDGLDNRRENIREVTGDQNRRNRRIHLGNPASRFMGVDRYRPNGKWRARIRIPGKHVSLGYYDTELAAALAREAYIVAHIELHATSNFPNTTHNVGDGPR